MFALYLNKNTMTQKEKDQLKSFNVKGLSDNSGINYERKLHTAFKNNTGKVLDATERAKAIQASKDATKALIKMFSDAESL